MNLNLHNPDINFSKRDTVFRGNDIYMGLSTIDKVGDKAVDDILSHQPYFSFDIFLQKRIPRKVNKSVVNKLYVDSLCCSNGSFSISNSTVEQNVNLKKCRFHDSFTITNNCIINAAIKLENIDAGGISFLNSTFTKSIYIWAGELVTLTFNNGVFEDNLKITAVPVNGMLTIIGTEYKKAVIFNIKDLLFLTSF